MKGDFSKLTFNPDKNFLRVLMQQGKVQLDSDWNEQAAILLHYMQTLAADLIGPYAGPEDSLGFKIDTSNGFNFSIGAGRYYVDGILCENHTTGVSYSSQPDYDYSTDRPPVSGQKNYPDQDAYYMVYLDVWERHISYLEDDDIREKALNGVDTATRSKVIWQVKVKNINIESDDYEGSELPSWRDVNALHNELLLSEVCLRAQLKPAVTNPDACCQHPEAKYRGAENQLYRVEIHDAGNKPTFKWSRENGSVVFPVTSITLAEDTIIVTLENLGRDDRLNLAVDDWVELVDDNSVLNNIANPLCRVIFIDTMTRTVKLTNITPVNIDILNYNEKKHPLLRRWDQKDDVTATANGIPVPANEDWLPIESGIEVAFYKKGEVRTGDYWLIPARTNTGEVEWSTKTVNDEVIPLFMSPHGVEHHYAPLAIVHCTAEGNFRTSDFRCKFKPLSYECTYSNRYGHLGTGIGTDLLCPDEAK